MTAAILGFIGVACLVAQSVIVNWRFGMVVWSFILAIKLMELIIQIQLLK